jgi:hypothetical protein
VQREKIVSQLLASVVVKICGANLELVCNVCDLAARLG